MSNINFRELADALNTFQEDLRPISFGTFNMNELAALAIALNEAEWSARKLALEQQKQRTAPSKTNLASGPR